MCYSGSMEARPVIEEPTKRYQLSKRQHWLGKVQLLKDTSK